jgi:hypothetical protein
MSMNDGPTDPQVTPSSGAMGDAGAEDRDDLPTGVGESKSFNEGENVWAFKIELENGKACESPTGNFFLENAPVGGIATDGVINPSSVPDDVVVCNP